MRPLGTPRTHSADFRGLKLTHNSAHVLDGVPGTRKLPCEVFSPLPLGLAESHCTRLPGSSARIGKSNGIIAPVSVGAHPRNPTAGTPQRLGVPLPAPVGQRAGEV